MQLRATSSFMGQFPNGTAAFIAIAAVMRNEFDDDTGADLVTEFTRKFASYEEAVLQG